MRTDRHNHRPVAGDSDEASAIRVLARARIASAPGRAGRARSLERRAAEIQQALRAEQPHRAGVVADALGAAARARVGVLVSLDQQIAELEAALSEHRDRHPDAEILRGLAGLGPVLGARVLGEFGDDPSRHADAGSRTAYAGTARNRRLADACER